MGSKKYICLTLGPITRTLMLAESTKGLWAASYLFSYLAREIIKPFEDRKFLFPSIETKFTGRSEGVGQFPDQYAFESKNDDFDLLTGTIEKVLENAAIKIAEKIEESNSGEILNSLKHYLKVSCTEVTFIDEPGLSEQDKEAKAREICKDRLALIELQDNFQSVEDRNYLAEFLEKVNISFLSKDAYGSNRSNKRLIKSTLEIAAHKYFPEEYSDEKADSQCQEVEQELPKLPACYRYMAIVNADTDNLGKAVRSLAKMDLDDALRNINNNAQTIIKKYGGTPVYMGGDDLFFFAPVKNGAQNILELIDDLTTAFNQQWEKAKEDCRPTLSFGIAIAYYKHPLFESVEHSRYLLEKCAKSRGKNSIALTLLKHSGQSMDLMIRRAHTESYIALQSLRNYFFKPNDQTTVTVEFLSSVVYWLRQNTSLIYHCVLKPKIGNNKEKMLQNLFDNNFNEAPHQKYRVLFKILAACIVYSYEEYHDEYCDEIAHKPSVVPGLGEISGENSDSHIAEWVFMNIFTLLRFVKFTLSQNDD